MIEIDELTEETAADVRKIFDAWNAERPIVRWPDGTTFTEPYRMHASLRYAAMTSWATLPCGDQYELLLSGKEEDPRHVPPVLWGLWVTRFGEVFACPRLANMSQRSPLEDKTRLYRGGGLGLEERYKIGMLPRGLREHTRTVSDGWGY